MQMQYLAEYKYNFTSVFAGHNSPLPFAYILYCIIVLINPSEAVDSAVIELPIILESTCEAEDAYPMPFSTSKLTLKLLPLGALQFVEVLEYLHRQTYIGLELWIVENSSTLVFVINPLALVDQHAIGDEPLAISTSLVVFEFTLIDLTVGET